MEKEVVRLRPEWPAGEALEKIRTQKVPGGIHYFYVVDDAGKLVGVLPTRRLLMAPAAQPVSDLMVRKLVTVKPELPLELVSELFVLHKFLAFPVVDVRGRLLGAVDVGTFTEEVFDATERKNMDAVFEAIGLRLSEARDAPPLRAWRLRFPWLLATIASGTACALLAGLFAETLEQHIVLAFFITLVLGLGEGVGTQSMTLAVQRLRNTRPTAGWFGRAVLREFLTALLLGLCCAAITGVTVLVWQGQPAAALAIGVSVVLALLSAATLGLAVPTVLHALRLDPRVAAGPLTLAIADLGTLTVYFSAGSLL
ncbi:MAG: magnesium transporter [Planctomycetes bacterium]|nr:magnesium transporter [Planctomycetota bacterium]